MTILDFKTGDCRRPQDRRRSGSRTSLQLDIYALAQLKTSGRLPLRVELRFLETGLAAGKEPTLEEAEQTEAVIRDVAAAIRQREFSAGRPTWPASSAPSTTSAPHRLARRGLRPTAQARDRRAGAQRTSLSDRP